IAFCDAGPMDAKMEKTRSGRRVEMASSMSRPEPLPQGLPPLPQGLPPLPQGLPPLPAPPPLPAIPHPPLCPIPGGPCF
ncbi:MAG: hypothetical protein K2Z76_16850, partial [Mycobacterium gordonae]|nr:hypothetical protein [Mycobacterium gordonae]